MPRGSVKGQHITKRKENGKLATGRPEKYTLEFCLAEIKDIWETLLKDERLVWSEKTNKYEIAKMKFITMQDIVRLKPYSRQYISVWKKEFEENNEFNDIIKKIEAELENRLVKVGMTNKASTAMCIFALKNHYNWKDKRELSGSDGEPMKIIVTLTE